MPERSNEFNPQYSDIGYGFEEKPVKAKKKKVKSFEAAEIRSPHIESLREPLKTILEKLKDKIDQGTYRIIIGDDASGRIPTLIFDRILKSLYREKNQTVPETMFLAGSSRIIEPVQIKKEAAIDRYFDSGSKKSSSSKLATDKFATTFKKFQNKKYRQNNRVLLISDVIDTGSGLKPLVSVLQKRGIPYDIATIALYSTERLAMVNTKLGPIVKGSFGSTDIYNSPELVGVSKNPRNVLATPLPRTRKDRNDQKIINSARTDVDNLSNELIHWYKTLKTSARAA